MFDIGAKFRERGRALEPGASGCMERQKCQLMRSCIRRFHQARLPGCVLCGTLAACAFTGVASADVITFGGAITQSTQDTGNPAQNNLTLNKIFDGDPYTFVLNYNGSITSPRTYTNFVPPNSCLTATAACFSDPTRMATETSFGVISLTITANGINDDFSLLGCLTTGGGCIAGNQLDANFEILAANLKSPNAMAVGLDQPHPLDLLEDDGVTDIHDSISSYSYTPTSAVHEPSSLTLLGLGLTVMALTVMATKRFRRFGGSADRAR